MEASCQEGRINVSEETKKLLESDPECPYRFEENTVVKIEKLGVEKRCWYAEPL